MSSGSQFANRETGMKIGAEQSGPDSDVKGTCCDINGSNFREKQQQHFQDNAWRGVLRVLCFLGSCLCDLSLTVFPREGGAPGPAGSVQPSTSRGGSRDRLPLLPRFRGKFVFRRNASHRDLHDLSLASVERRAHSLARSRESGVATANRVDAGQSTAGLCFLQSRHSRAKRHWLFDVSWGRGPDAHYLEGAILIYAMVPGLP